MIRMRLLYLLLLVVVLSCSHKVEQETALCEYIAHAGGAIDGYVYTNSLEAMENAAALGYRYIELDLQYTADSVLVAAHSWGDFNRITGFVHCGDTAPVLKEFVARRIYGKYTPVTLNDINDFFTRHKELFLVTDKVSDVQVLNEAFPSLKERMVVEAFSYDDYRNLLSDGYYRVLYSCMAEDLYSSLVKHMMLHALFHGPKIEWLALHTSAAEYPFFALVNTLCDFKTALFTVNDISLIPDVFDERLRMLYTDSIIPCNR